MIDDRLHDNNNDNITSYHQRHFSHFTGFPQYHNTNIDKVCQFLDENTFQSFLDFQEQDRAYDINYAHGLELDDEFGDIYGIDRNGLDDDSYRFILKCHMLAIKCNGTLPELVNFISTVLGCSDNDVTLGLARHYVNGRYIGDPDTILIKDININNVSNDRLVPLLSDQLQLAVAADKRVQSVNFFDIIPNSLYTACTVKVTARAKIPIQANITDNIVTSTTLYMGLSINAHANATIKPMKINNTITPINVYTGLSVNAHANAETNTMRRNK